MKEETIPPSFSYIIYPFSRKEISIDYVLSIVKKFDEKNEKITVQVLNPAYIVSEKQIQIAIYQTVKAFKKEENIAKERATEFLLRLAGHRQIKKALKYFGINDENDYILFICFGGHENARFEILDKIAEEIGFSNNEIMKKLPVSNLDILKNYYSTDEGIETIEKFAIERIASLKLDY